VKPYYADESVTLYHGDCRDILPTLDQVDLVLSDPPYGINYVSNNNVGQGTRPITNDGARLSVALMRRVIPMLQTKHILWFTRWDVWPDVWYELGGWFPLRGMLIWDKGNNGMGNLDHWGPSYEMIASAGYGKTRGSRDQSVLRYPQVPPGSRFHPTEKPVAMQAYLIDKLDAQVTLDPFAGSGTTLVAAALAGRCGIGIEIDERYCEIAARRMSQAVLGSIERSSAATPGGPTAPTAGGAGLMPMDNRRNPSARSVANPQESLQFEAMP
jgi:16S rRNA G966 N2-methylase RsmD